MTLSGPLSQAIAKLAQRKPKVAAQILEMELFGESLSSHRVLEEMRTKYPIRMSYVADLS